MFALPLDEAFVKAFKYEFANNEAAFCCCWCCCFDDDDDDEDVPVVFEAA